MVLVEQRKLERKIDSHLPKWQVYNICTTLKEKLDKVASAETSVNPELYRRIATSPLYGHCAVIAIIVNFIFGGFFCSINPDGGSHWFNQIPGYDIDLLGSYDKNLGAIQVVPAGTLYNSSYFKRQMRDEKDINVETWLRMKALVQKLVKSEFGLRF